MQLEDLSRRVAECEARLGVAAGATPSKGQTMNEKVSEMTRKVNDIFQRERKLVDFERGIDSLEGWLHAEHASVSRVVMHSSAKRNYVLQHSQQLEEFVKMLQQVESLEQFINPVSIQEMPKYNDQLRSIEAKSAVTVGSAMQLYDNVSTMAEDYHKTMLALNSQLLAWDKLLSK